MLRQHAGRWVVLCTVLLQGYFIPAEDTAKFDYFKTLFAIASDIEALKSEFPQLKDFTPSKAVHPRTLSIEYGYSTHRAHHRGGWTSQVPNPNEDGVWFYINLHDSSSRAQIDTQPARSGPGKCLGEKRITFLILDGKSTKPLAGAIATALDKHGAATCSD